MPVKQQCCTSPPGGTSVLHMQRQLSNSVVPVLVLYQSVAIAVPSSRQKYAWIRIPGRPFRSEILGATLAPDLMPLPGDSPIDLRVPMRLGLQAVPVHTQSARRCLARSPVLPLLDALTRRRCALALAFSSVSLLADELAARVFQAAFSSSTARATPAMEVDSTAMEVDGAPHCAGGQVVRFALSGQEAFTVSKAMALGAGSVGSGAGRCGFKIGLHSSMCASP